MTDTPMTPDRDPSRREELLFMLLHGGARSEAIAQRVVDLALAEARAEKKTEVDRLRKALSDATGQVAELEDGLGQASAENAALRERIREAARPSRFSATPAQVDAFLRQHFAEDTYLGFQQAIGAHALEEAVEDAGAVRASADNDGLYNTDWREGWDDAIERVDPDRNGPTPVQLIQFGEATP
ncbi:hypothetical protein [Streptomyces sp. PvR018]|uniref:hypothetical protein n=1 Tax=Streptomyces sp. PvR018 TaxID=3156442 RepID=UPI003390CFBD